MGMFTPVPFLMGGPAELRAQVANQQFFNAEQERRTLAALETHIRENFTNRIVTESQAAIRNIDDGAREASQALSGLDAKADDLMRRVKAREVSVKDARKERDALVREGARIHQVYEAAVEDHERQAYSRDHPEDVIDFLVQRYPELRGNLPLFYL